MKKSILAVLILSSPILFAQKIKVEEGNEKFSTGSQNAASATIYEADVDFVIKEWKKVLKEYKYEKVKDDNNEVFGDNITIKEWGNNPADFYTKFVEDKKAKTIKMSTAVDLGGAYVKSSDNSDKYKFLEKMTKEFAIKMSKAPIEDKLNDANKTLSKEEGRLKDLEKDKKNLQDDVVDYKNKINKAEKEVIVKEAELEKKKGEVKVQKKVVDASSDAVSEQAKSAKKIYDKLEGQQKDLEKDIKDLNNDIKNYKEKIEKAEKDIKTNEENQEKKKKEIEEAKKAVADIKKKLESID